MQTEYFFTIMHFVGNVDFFFYLFICLFFKGFKKMFSNLNRTKISFKRKEASYGGYSR